MYRTWHSVFWKKELGPLVISLALSACGGGQQQSASAPLSGVGPLADGSAVFAAQAQTFSVDEDSVLSNAVAASQDNDVNFGLITLPASGQVSMRPDGEFTYTPQLDFFGQDSFDFYAWSDTTGSAPSTVTINVEPIADAPAIVGEPSPIAEQGRRYLVRFVASDVDVEDLVFSAINLPQWLSIDEETGVLFGTPGQPDVGIYRNIEISVTDTTNIRTAFPAFDINVLDRNEAPSVNPLKFPTRADARERISANLFPSDPDGDFVTISAERNEYFDIEISGGALAATALDVDEVTTTSLVIVATDSAGAISRERMPITVYPLSDSGKGRTIKGHKSGAGVHMVIVGDGYQVTEMDAFEQHAVDLLNLMRSDMSVRPHLDAWNVHALATASLDSGIDDNATEDIKNTIFDASYYCRDIARLICANEVRMFEMALAEYPYLDQLILLVNDRRYGGSGGSVAIASAFAPEIALHEMGHSIAGLADEYVDGLIQSSPEPELEALRFPNVSTDNDPTSVPWSAWIDDVSEYPTITGQAGVGIFEGGYYRASGIYRPTSTSRMRSNDQPFGPVNGEQWVLSLYEMTNAVERFGPILRTMTLDAGQNARFFVAPLFDSSVQEITWMLNGRELPDSHNKRAITLQPTAGSNVLELKVEDITGLIRRPPPHAGVFEWTWNIITQ